MKLFSPDIFSVSNISYRNVSIENRILVERVVHQNYALLDLVVDVRQLSAMEINSNNFMVQTRAGSRFLLKRIAVNTALDALESQYQSSEILRRAGVPMPEVLANDEGMLVTLNDRQERWTLTKFVEGEYYSGGEEALIKIGIGLGKIIEVFKNQDSKQLPVNSAVGSADEFECSFSRLMSSKQEWGGHFSEPNLSLLLEQESSLVGTGKLILEGLSKLHTLPVAALHTDLHPHNVLVNDDGVAAFVDVDSLQLNIRAISIAFAVYKLVRQHAVKVGYTSSDATHIRRVARVFLSSISGVVEISDAEVEYLRFAASFEIYRRILIISNLNIIHGNSVWNKVLPMHFNALHEIPYIFD
jgi:Ser/Thr protein kinase RdoA (MazF antagonist)